MENQEDVLDIITEGASSGPVSTLPGHRKVAPCNTRCYNHEDRIATTSIQGETDSFGCEYTFYCSECVSEFDKNLDTATIHECDWCKTTGEVFPTRDIDEGMCGRVYYCCKKCIDKQHT